MSALSLYLPFIVELVVKLAESVVPNDAETCNRLLPWLARNIRTEAPGKDTE